MFLRIGWQPCFVLSTYLVFMTEFMRLKQFFCFLFVFFHVSLTDLFSQKVQPDWVTGQRDTLPEWVCSMPEEGIVVSASDPCMSLENGRRQAIRRALWLFNLQNRVQVQMLSDVFSSTETSLQNVERHSNKILSLIMMSNKKKVYGYEIMNEYQTLFGEVILQIRFTVAGEQKSVGLETSSFSSQSEWMILYTDDKYTQKEYKVMIDIQSDEGHSDSFEMKGSLEHPVICSLFEGKQLFVPQKGCWYQELSSVDTCLVIEGKDLKYSFWTAYIAGLADQLFSYSFPESNIQTVLDNYQGNLMYDLSREKAKGYITAIPQILGISQNRLIVDWKIVPVVDGRNG